MSSCCFFRFVFCLVLPRFGPGVPGAQQASQGCAALPSKGAGGDREEPGGGFWAGGFGRHPLVGLGNWGAVGRGAGPGARGARGEGRGTRDVAVTLSGLAEPEAGRLILGHKQVA